MVLTVQDKQILVYHKEEFQLPLHISIGIEKLDRKHRYIFMFPENNSAGKGLTGQVRLCALNQYKDVILPA